MQTGQDGGGTVETGESVVPAVRPPPLEPFAELSEAAPVIPKGPGLVAFLVPATVDS